MQTNAVPMTPYHRFLMVLMALIFVGGAYAWWDEREPKNDAAASPAPAQTAEAPHPQTAEEKLGAEIADQKTLRGAIDLTVPLMGNGNDFSNGAWALSAWEEQGLQWNELAEIPASSYSLVMKDSESELGKRICARGQLIEIHADSSSGSKVYTGGLASLGETSIGLYRFIAVKSTGDLVEGSGARFCGIVTGTVDYQNSAGGITHAVQLAGMFDLPENHR